MSFGVATSVDRCRFDTGCCETHCSGCVKVARCCGCMRNTIVFAAEDRKSYWNGCIKAAKVNCQQIFSILVLIIFLLKFLLKSASKSAFCRFGVEIRFWSCNFDAIARSSIVFCNSVSADRIVVDASKVAWCSGCMRNSLLQLKIVNRIGTAASRLRK